MTIQVQPLQIGDIARADFRTSLSADVSNGMIQKKFGYPFRYQPARVAIAISLRNTVVPPAAPDASGRSIKGDFLFSSDEAELSAWVALIAQHSGDANLTRKGFQTLVAGHWARGMTALVQLAVTLPPQPEALFEALGRKFDFPRWRPE